ncbi:hypothetical protein VNO77_17123 [Canavalia gladiata]|uniref:Uncharacterized protein n=1 Tax=Canavalia gladiata TaxID=3824 RepID=A0AAN9LN98_CANGL
MSPRNVEPISLMSSRISILAQPVDSINPWSKWGLPNGKLNWTPSADDVAAGFSYEGSNMGTQMDSFDHAVFGAWLEKMQLDQVVAQQN